MLIELFSGAAAVVTALAALAALGQYWSERTARLEARERDAQKQASCLTVWVASDRNSNPKVFGIVLDNSSGSMFHDLVINSVVHKKAQRPAKLLTLPPGRYFLEFNGTSWEFAQEDVEHLRHLRPYMQSADYMVTSLEFSDNRRQRWMADQRAILTRM